MCDVAGIFAHGTDANNLKFMHSSATGQIVDCSEFVMLVGSQ